MIKRSDIWTVFLITAHIFLLQQFIVFSQILIMSNTAQYGNNTNPLFWVKTGITTIFIFLFFNSLYKTIQLALAPKEEFEQLLRQSLTVLFWLLGFYFIISIFPQF